ncbi:unnamed protein product [Rhodiola kirilowii]
MCCQLMMTSVVEKASTKIRSPHKNKRKARADNRLRDSNKTNTPDELPAKNIRPNHGLNGGCQMCDGCGSDLDSQKQRFGHSYSSLQEGLLEGDSDGAIEEKDEDILGFVDWCDSARSELQSLVISNLDAVFKIALKKIVAHGYSEEVATKAVMSPGICYGSKDTLSNIVDNTLKFLKTFKDPDLKGHNCLMDLKELEDYLLTEFIYILRFIRPFYSPGDMLWYLLVSDLNVSDACAVVFGQYDISQDTSSNVRPHPLPKNQLDNAIKRLDMDMNPPLTGRMSSSAADFQREISSWFSNMTDPKDTSNLSKQSGKEEGSQSSVNVVDWSFVVSRTSQRLEAKGKFSSSRKVHFSGTLKSESNLGQKLHHVDKGCRTHGYSKSFFKQGKFFGLTTDKKTRSSGEFNPKNASMKISKAVAVKYLEGSTKRNCTTVKGNANPTSALCSSCVASSLPVTSSTSNSTISEATCSDSSYIKKEASQTSCVCPADITNCNHEGVIEDSKGQSTNPDYKAEMIFLLISRSYKLKDQLEQWTEWANSRVLQATRKLTRHKDELNVLRHEKKNPERLKQSIEENTKKKLAEIENALSKANGQVEYANCTLRELEVKNSALKREMEVAKLQSVESAANCQEISERERKALSSVKSWEKQKNSLQEELNSEKQKYAHTHKEFLQARGVLAQLEAKWKHELKAKEDLQLQASSIKMEMEQSEALRKFREDAFRSKAESNLQKYKDDIKMLEREIVKLSMSTDANKTSVLTKGINEGPGSKASSTKKFPMLNEDRLSHTSKKVQNSSNKGTKVVKRERECVMCLSEEISVVFLPCAHQVICAKCNELHEKNGMKDCPSCRSMIQRRIAVRYRSP